MPTKPLSEAFAYGIEISKCVFHVVAVKRKGAVIRRARCNVRLCSRSSIWHPRP